MAPNADAAFRELNGEETKGASVSHKNFTQSLRWVPPAGALEKMLKLPKLRSKEVIQSTPELKQAIDAHNRSQQQGMSMTVSRANRLSLPQISNGEEMGKRLKAPGSRWTAPSGSGALARAAAGIDGSLHEEGTVEYHMAEMMRLQGALNALIGKRQAKEKELEDLTQRTAQGVEEAVINNDEVTELERIEMAQKDKMLQIEFANAFTVQLVNMVERLRKDKDEAHDKVQKQRKLVDNVNKDLNELDFHLRECNGALSAAVAEQGAQRDLLDNALALKEAKIAARKEEAAKAHELMEQEEEVFKKWEERNMKVQAEHEARRKKRLDQAQLLNFQPTGRHSPEEIVYMNLIEVAQVDSPQALVDAFAELAKKKQQIKKNQASAEERIAELNKLYHNLEDEERKIFSGDRTSQSGDANQALTELGNLEHMEQRRNRALLQHTVKAKLLVSVAAGLQTLVTKLGVSPEEAAQKFGLSSDADEGAPGSAGTGDATATLVQTLPLVLDDAEATLEDMMLEAGIPSGQVSQALLPVSEEGTEGIGPGEDGSGEGTGGAGAVGMADPVEVAARAAASSGAQKWNTRINLNDDGNGVVADDEDDYELVGGIRPNTATEFAKCDNRASSGGGGGKLGKKQAGGASPKKKTTRQSAS